MFVHKNNRTTMVWSKTVMAKYGKIYLTPENIVISKFTMDTRANKLKSFVLKCRYIVDLSVKRLIWRYKYGKHTI